MSDFTRRRRRLTAWYVPAAVVMVIGASLLIPGAASAGVLSDLADLGSQLPDGVAAKTRATFAVPSGATKSFLYAADAESLVQCPDGRALTAGSRDRTVLSREVYGDNQLRTALDGHAGPVSSVAFSPNGRTLATATENGTVQLWDVRSDTRLRTLKGLAGIVDGCRVPF